MLETFDLVVVGGGHAGCEAARLGARLGFATLLITMNLDSIAAMPCNPAIGGLGKGHLVRELDALGGAMAQVIDATRIQFRYLNASKGQAVRSSRAQADRHRYADLFRQQLFATEGLRILQDEVTALETRGEAISGVRTRGGIALACRAVVLCPGTFLNGKIHIGLNHFPGGRAQEAPATHLSSALERLGLRLGRFKTGTVPRLDARSIDFSRLVPQEDDDPGGRFSFTPVENSLPQRRCYITYTNERTHAIIRENLDRAPLYTGDIRGIGPRYCPSIEDKVVRFAERTRHQIFVEPEGLDTPEIYPNGIPTSLPYDVQLAMVRSIEGFEKAVILRPGYAVEYDYVPPTQLRKSLETQAVHGLFLAGQLNGTSGYEEAAAQGLMAGLNAVRYLQEEPPVILERSQAYIGVMIDDLVTRGTEEPYRMLTSRAEYRLLLREDNADLRLRPVGREVGLVDDASWATFQDKQQRLARCMALVQQARVHPQPEVRAHFVRLGITPPTQSVTLAELLKRPHMAIEALLPLNLELAAQPIEVLDQLETALKYEGYIRRQEEQVGRDRRLEEVVIPDGFDFAAVPGLSTEVRQRLASVHPQTLGQAGRIPGLTPAAISILSVWLKRQAGQHRAPASAEQPPVVKS